LTGAPCGGGNSKIVYEDTTPQFVGSNPSIVEKIAPLSGLTNPLSPTAISTLQIWLTHTWNADMTIRLYAPDSSYITITNQDGGVYDNVFDGTLFTDSASSSVSTYYFLNDGVVSPLKPRDPFTNLRGKNPNGQWKVWFQDTYPPTDDGNINRVILMIQGKVEKMKNGKKKNDNYK